MSDKPYHCPWVAKHKDGNIYDLGQTKRDAEKLFEEIGFDKRYWKIECIRGNMHDPKWWREEPCSLPSDFFKDNS